MLARPKALLALGVAPQPGDCDVLEDPDLDGRSAEPVWTDDPDELAWADGTDHPQAAPFSLWSLPGRKTLQHDGYRLLLTSVVGRQTARMALGDRVVDGSGLAYTTPAGRRFARQQDAAAAVEAVLNGNAIGAVATAAPRTALTHMQRLFAVDAKRTGLSDRSIAAVLFGERVVAGDWDADSALRARVRYLVKTGRNLVDGGYQGLLRAAA